MSVATRRAAKTLTVKDWRGRRAGPSVGFDDGDLSLVRRELQDCFGSVVAGLDLDRLLTTEAAELVALVKRAIPPAEAAPPAQVDSPEKIEAFVEITRRHAETGHPALRPRIEALAEHAIASQRVPRVGPKLEVLPEPEAPEPRRRLDLSQLDESETARLEALVERGMGAEPGSVFEARRAKAAFTARLHELAARVKPGPRKRRVFEEPGTALIPPGLYGDLLRADGESVWMSGCGVGAFALVALTLEGRRLHPAVEKSGRFARIEAGGSVLAIHQGFSAWGAAAADFEGFSQGLDDCARMKWLCVERGADHFTRISYGPKMVAWLAARREEP